MVFGWVLKPPSIPRKFDQSVKNKIFLPIFDDFPDKQTSASQENTKFFVEIVGNNVLE